MDDEAQYSIPEVLDWLRSRKASISRQVTVREGRRAEGPTTTVQVDHILKNPGQGVPSLRISSRPTRLPAWHFTSYARMTIHGTNANPRGRALYCHDLEAMEVVAAVSFHIDERKHWPVFVTALASRTDSLNLRYLQFRSESGLLVLKQHLHVLSEKLDRGGALNVDLIESIDAAALADRLGFRPAPALKGLRPSGKHLRQVAL